MKLRKTNKCSKIHPEILNIVVNTQGCRDTSCKRFFKKILLKLQYPSVFLQALSWLIVRYYREYTIYRF